MDGGGGLMGIFIQVLCLLAAFWIAFLIFRWAAAGALNLWAGSTLPGHEWASDKLAVMNSRVR
jgi:hypothetical protein